MITFLRRMAWAPVCFIFGHNYRTIDARPFTDVVRCKDCGHIRTGEPTIQ
jgi:hypothetical protein